MKKKVKKKKKRNRYVRVVAFTKPDVKGCLPFECDLTFDICKACIIYDFQIQQEGLRVFHSMKKL